MVQATFISETMIAGNSKQRWECPVCKANKAPECRFNLSSKKLGKTHKCRFCKTTLEIRK